MIRRACLLLMLLVSGLAAVSCRTAGDEAATTGIPPSRSTASADTHDLPVPPGLDEHVVTPLRGDDRKRAAWPLDQVVDAISTPEFLQPASSESTEPAPASTDIPVAAQRAYIAGRLAWREGDSFQAIPHLESALRLSPNQPRILRLLGRIYTGMGNKVRGAQYFQQAVEADPTDLEGIFLLGRFALEQGDWEEAIAVLSAARRLAETADRSSHAPVDPAMDRLLSYYLATALMEEGYAAAAIEQFEQHLAGASDAPRTTPLAREIELLDQQASSTWQAIGDLHHQLGQPREARHAYEQALEEQPHDTSLLNRRLVYTYVLLGLNDQAQQRVLQHIEQGRADSAAISLVRYLIENGAGGDDFGRKLADVYHNQDQSGSLVLALAELLPPDDAQTLLIDHLRQQPHDKPVFDRLLTRHLLPDRANASPNELRQAIGITTDLMAAAPPHAEDFAIALMRVADTGTMLELFRDPDDASAPDTPETIMRRVLHGLAAADANQIDQAQGIFEQIIEVEPDLAMPRVHLARLLIFQNRYDQASKVLEPLHNSNEPGVIALRVHVLSETGQVDEALALLDQMIRQGDANTALVLQKASLQMQQGQDVAAERTLLDALNVHPRDERLYEALLQLYDPPSGRSDIPDSMRQWQRLVRRLLGTIPHSRIGRLVRAELHDAKGEFDQAEDLLKQLLEENQHDARALRDLLQLYLRADRRDDAMVLLESRVADNLDDPQLLALVGKFYKDLGEHQKMLDTVERLVRTQPDTAQRSIDLARLSLDRNQPTQAVEFLESALSAQSLSDPNDALRLLGDALLQLDRGDEAEKRYHQAIRDYPDHASDLTYALASLVTQRGDRPRADQILLDLLEADPGHGPANNDLGYNWVTQGKNLEQARDMIQKAVDSDPQSAAYLDSLGWAYYMLGRFEDAETWLRRSRQAQGGQNPVILEHLGDTLYRLGQSDEAIRAWEEAILLAESGLPARYEQMGDVLYRLGRVAEGVHMWLQAHAMQNGTHDPLDPEMNGIVDRIQARIDAVQADDEPDVTAIPSND